MLKRSLSRNTRAQGIKVKRVLQILVLLGIGIWLIYQVKHSRDKKKELNDAVERFSGEMQNDQGYLKLGRKDLDPREEKLDAGEKQAEEDEDETVEHDKEDENQDREEIKREETENEGRGGGDDDQGESERAEKQSEEETSSEDHDHDENTRGAREEQYKGDDASSAVAHDARPIDSQTEEMISDLNNLEHENGNSTKDGWQQNSILKTDNPVANGPDQVRTEADNGSAQNPVSFKSQRTETDPPAIVPVDETTGNDPVSDHTNSDQNPIISSKDETGNGTVVELPNSSDETKSNRSGEIGSKSSEPGEEGADLENGSENPARDDPVDSSDSHIAHEMHETRFDLDTLPETRTEIDDSDETAAE